MGLLTGRRMRRDLRALEQLHLRAVGALLRAEQGDHAGAAVAYGAAAVGCAQLLDAHPNDPLTWQIRRDAANNRWNRSAELAAAGQAAQALVEAFQLTDTPGEDRRDEAVAQLTAISAASLGDEDTTLRCREQYVAQAYTPADGSFGLQWLVVPVLTPVHDAYLARDGAGSEAARKVAETLDAVCPPVDGPPPPATDGEALVRGKPVTDPDAYPLARSFDEATLHMRLAPHAACGGADMVTDSLRLSVYRDAHDVRVYRFLAACRNCGGERIFLFHLMPYPLDLPLGVAGYSHHSTSPSQLVDAGQYLAAAENYLSKIDELPANDTGTMYAICSMADLAVAALDETMRFLRRGEDAIAADRVWSAISGEAIRARPELLGRAHLDGRHAEAVEVRDQARRRHMARIGLPWRPPQARSAPGQPTRW